MASYYYSGAAAQQSRQVREAERRISAGEDPNKVKSQYPSELSGRINLATRPPKTFSSNEAPEYFDGKAYQKGSLTLAKLKSDRQKAIDLQLSTGTKLNTISVFNTSQRSPRLVEKYNLKYDKPTVSQSQADAMVSTVSQQQKPQDLVSLGQVRKQPTISTKERRQTISGSDNLVQLGQVPRTKVEKQYELPRKGEVKSTIDVAPTRLKARSFGSQFKEAFIGTYTLDPTQKSISRQTPAQKAGTVTAGVFSILPFGRFGFVDDAAKVVKATSIGEKIFGTAAKTSQTIKATKAGQLLTTQIPKLGLTTAQFGEQLFVGGAKATAAVELGKARGRSVISEKYTDTELRSIIESGARAEYERTQALRTGNLPTLPEGQQYGKYDIRKATAGVKSFFKSTAADSLPLVPRLKPEAFEEKTFRESFIEDQKNQGVSQAEAEKRLKDFKRYQTSAGAGELGGLLVGGMTGEATGRRAAAQEFKRLQEKGITALQGRFFTSGVGGRTFLTTATGGAVEAPITEFAQQQARERGVIMNPQERAKEIGIATGIGSLTAGGITGTITGLETATSKGSKSLGKVVNIGSFIIDPLEKPSDILEDISQGARRNIFGQNIKKPQLRINPEIKTTIKAPKMSDIGGITIQQSSEKVQKPTVSFAQVIEKGKKRPKGQGIISSILPKTFTKSKTAITPITNMPILPQTKSDTKQGLPIEPYVPIPTITETKENTNINTFTFQSDQKTQNYEETLKENVNVFNQVYSNVPVNTRTPQLRIPPPVPLLFPSTGSTKKGSRKGKKFINELAAGQALLGKLIRGKPQPKPKMIPKPKKGRKKESKQLMNFNKLLFG